MSKQKIEIEVDVPDGFEVTAWRPCVEGEWIIESGNSAAKALRSSVNYRQMILRRIEPAHVKLAKYIISLTNPPAYVLPGGDAERLAKQVLAEYESSLK